MTTPMWVPFHTFMTPGAFNPLRGGAAIAHQMGSVIEALKRRPKWAQKTLGELL